VAYLQYLPRQFCIEIREAILYRNSLFSAFCGHFLLAFVSRKPPKNNWQLTAVTVVVLAVASSQIKKTAIDAATSSETLSKLSKMLRPYAIVKTSLTSEGIFEYDEGTRDILDSANLKKVGTNNDVVLILHLKQFVISPPLVRSLSPEVFTYSFWNTNKYDWAYLVRSTSFSMTADGATTLGTEDINEQKQFRFLLEGFTVGK
jgi:hypothetical protein